MLEARGIVNDCYILRERIGEDAACELWRATAIYSASQLLLRFVKAGLEPASEAFRAEVMRCLGVAGPGIKPIVEVERHGGRLFVASEYSGERNLREVIAATRGLALERVCAHAIGLAESLDAFHRQGLVFGGLDAASVLVRLSGGAIDELRVQKPGYRVFLPLLPAGEERLEALAYLAPELKAGGKGDPRSDIYSIGVHLFRFLAGKLPFGPRSKALEGGSASLSHVANALARRGVPEPVMRATLRCLRKDPGRRQPGTLELMAELRAFVDERRRESRDRGEADPLAGLDRVNLDKMRVGAGEALKMLDTVEYFRALSEDYVARLPSGPGRSYPFEDFADRSAVEKVEALEAEADDEDGGQSLDWYLERAFRTVAAEPWAEKSWKPPAPKPGARLPAPDSEDAALGYDWSSPTELEPLEGPEDGEGSAPDLSLASPLEELAGRMALTTEVEAALPAGEPRPPTPASAPTSPPLPAPTARAPAAPVPTRPAAPAPAPLPGASPKSKARRRPSRVAAPEGPAGQAIVARDQGGGVSWKEASAAVEDIVAGMDADFRKALRGRGAFRFIQEPPPGLSSILIARSLERFRLEGFFADSLSVETESDAVDLLRPLRAALAAAARLEPRVSLSLFRRRLALRDPLGALSAAPLGAVLGAVDGPEPGEAALEAAALETADAVAAFGRRRKPLVLILRGCEAAGPGAHALLLALAQVSAERPVCCFAFFKPRPLPSWHVLSRFGRA